MIIWILSKLFSANALAKAASMKPGIIACQLTTEAEIDDMNAIFNQCSDLIKKRMQRYSSEVDENVVHH